MERGGTEVDLAGSCKASQNGGVVSGKASSYPPGGTRAQPGRNPGMLRLRPVTLAHPPCTAAVQYQIIIRHAVRN